MKCLTCGKPADQDGYCESHEMAHENITKKYREWKKAMGISWKEYLNKIIENPLTGEWAKEVAQYLIKTGGK